MTVRPLLLALLLTACAADREPATPQAAPQPVGLGAYVAGVQATRADASLLADGGIPRGQSIGVYAYYHDHTTWSEAATPNFMFNQQATCTDPATAYTYSPLKYWPNEAADRLSFVAYYPYSTAALAQMDDPDGGTGIEPLLSNPSTAGLPRYRFRVKTNPEHQVDFLVSTLLKDLPHSADEAEPGSPETLGTLAATGRVRFSLYHATAKIIISVEVADNLRNILAYYTLRQLSLNNLFIQGELAYNGAGTALQWSTYSEKTPATRFEPGAEQLLLPQSLADDAELHIGYSLTFKTDGTVYRDGQPVDEYTYSTDDVAVRLNTLASSKTGQPVAEWLPGHVYHYHIRLTAQPIGFTGEVADWGEYIDLDDYEWQE